MVRHLAGLSVVIGLAWAHPAFAEIRPGDLTLTVTPERNGGAAPFVREMVLLRIKGIYRQQILLEEMIQPSLANFSWTQLGRDHWGKTKLPDGQNALMLDRVIAVFPHHAGSFTIEPFIHRLTVNDDGQRRVVDVKSEPVPLPVAEWTAPTGGPDAKEPWWLPAHDVTITDSWSPDPETVKVGETTRRIVTLEAQGLVAEGLPPRPVMRTRGILTFAGPVTRETIITPSGPIARATYQWDVRPAIAEIIPLDAIAIPWFDTNARVMREAEIPARQIGGGLPDQEKTGLPPGASPLLALAAGLVAFGTGLALIGFGFGRRKVRLARSLRLRLRQAALDGNARAFRRTLGDAFAAQPELRDAWLSDPRIQEQFKALDREVYAPSVASSSLDLRKLADALSRTRVVSSKSDAVIDPLKPLDGPVSQIS